MTALDLFVISCPLVLGLAIGCAVVRRLRQIRDWQIERRSTRNVRAQLAARYR